VVDSTHTEGRRRYLTLPSTRMSRMRPSAAPLGYPPRRAFRRQVTRNAGPIDPDASNGGSTRL
jgi:hypothetical protein